MSAHTKKSALLQKTHDGNRKCAELRLRITEFCRKESISQDILAERLGCTRLSMKKFMTQVKATESEVYELGMKYFKKKAFINEAFGNSDFSSSTELFRISLTTAASATTAAKISPAAVPVSYNNTSSSASSSGGGGGGGATIRSTASAAPAAPAALFPPASLSHGDAFMEERALVEKYYRFNPNAEENKHSCAFPGCTTTFTDKYLHRKHFIRKGSHLTRIRLSGGIITKTASSNSDSEDSDNGEISEARGRRIEGQAGTNGTKRKCPICSAEIYKLTRHMKTHELNLGVNF